MINSQKHYFIEQEVFLSESYIQNLQGKKYYHWLERANLGQLESIVIRWPKKVADKFYSHIFSEKEYLTENLHELVRGKTYSYTENVHKSQLFELAEGTKYVPNQSLIRELSRAVCFRLTNETEVSFVEATQINWSPSIPREINPIYIEKKFDYRTAKLDTKLVMFTQILGGSPLSANEMLMAFVIFELLNNLIILKDKFPQFKIYMSVPTSFLNEIEENQTEMPLYSGIESVLEIKEISFNEARAKKYYLRSTVHVDHNPNLGSFLLSEYQDRSKKEMAQSLQLSDSEYIYSTGLLILGTQPHPSKAFSELGQLFSTAEKSHQDYNFHGHSKIHQLNQLLKVENNIQFDCVNVEPIQYGLSYENGAVLEGSSASFSVWTEFDYEGSHYRVHNFTTSVKKVFCFLNKGLSYFSEQDRKDLASYRKGSKRDHDLKILKHQGVAALIATEICFYLTGQPLTSGQIELSEADFFSIIENNIFNLFKKSIFVDKYGEAFVAGTHLKDYISDKVYDFLMATVKTVFNLLNENRRYLVLEKNFICLTDKTQFPCQIILAFLEPVINATRGDVFSKGSSKYFKGLELFTDYEDEHEPLFKDSELIAELKHQSNLKINLAEYITPFFYGKMTELSGLNWLIYIDGEPIEKLTEGDFQSELLLQNGKTDWFELSPQLFFKGLPVRLEDIKFSSVSGSKVNNGIIFYKGRPYIIDPKSLPKYALLEKFWERIKKEATLGSVSKEKEFVRIPRSAILELLSLAEAGTKIVTDNPYWDEIYSFYKSIGTQNHQLQIPEPLNSTLKDYQLTGAQWIHDLYRLHLGGVLADDMGLGKTLQTLTFLDQHRRSGHNTWSLIVVPTSLCFNWINEGKKFTPELDIEIFASNRKKQFKEMPRDQHKVIIVTYGLLIEHEDYFCDVLWDIVVFDEAQNLKNLSSRRTSSARLIKAKFKLALSGTPLENNYLDFYSILDLVLPGSLGSYKSFNEVFGLGKPVQGEDIIQLKRKIKPIVLRRTKSSVNLNLPIKTEESYFLDFTEQQLEIYKKLALTHNDQITQLIKEQGAASTQIAMLTALLRLRQVCSDPNGVPQIVFNETPPKLSYIIDCIFEHLENKRSVLVFTQFLTTLDNLSKLFVKNNIPFSTIHGAVSSKNRSLILDQFQNSEQPQVLLMTLKTGGVGLNLTKASVVYHVEPWWNPAVENQATDRVHRLGQKNDIQVYRLIMKESVEEKIELLKLKKKSYFDSLFSLEEGVSGVKVEATEPTSNYLSYEDFKYLLS